MKKKILITSTDVMMLQFLVPHVFYLQNQGYEVEVACSNVENHVDELKDIFKTKVKMHLVELKRNPMQISNIRGLLQLMKIIKAGSYDIIWTNEPVMGIMTRLAARIVRRKKVKIIYVAHGFHFYKGAPKKNWIVYYPIEKIFSLFTDEIVTINNEDYNFARQNFTSAKVVKFPGIGINTGKFFKEVPYEVIEEKKRELGIENDEKVILSVGELEKRKNHETSVRAFKAANIGKAKLLICGVGTQESSIRKLIEELQLEQKVFLLGYRTDISELCHMADVFLFTTYQEGLSVALMEAMSVGVPCIVSKIRGNVDLIEKGKGIYCNPYDMVSCASAITKYFKNQDRFEDIVKYNQNKIKEFDIEKVTHMMERELEHI